MYKTATLGFSVFVYLFHTYLDVRQFKALKIPHPPASMAKFRTAPSEEEFRKTQSYNIDKWWFNLAHSVWSILFDVTFLATDSLARLWMFSDDLVVQRGFARAVEVQTSVAFVLLFGGMSMALEVPWSLYSTFVVEERHGFNKQTLRLFCMDLLKSVLLGLAVAPPLVAAFTYILLHSGPWLVAYVWVFAVAVQLAALTVYPTLIAPLFNKFEPLPEGELRQSIEALAASLKFPLKKLYVVDGSTRSAHSNAYMFGIGRNKRIVLFDTLVEQCTTEQMAMFSAVQHNDAVLADFGFDKHRPALARFILFTYLLAPLDEVLGFLSHVLSRRYEFQADAFAVKLDKGEELQGGLLSLETNNRSAANVDSWFSAFHYSHPPIPERLAAISELMKKGQ